MLLDYFYFCYKEADPLYNYIVAEFFFYYTYYIYFGWDCNMKKILDTEFERVQRVYIYLNNKLLSAEILIDFVVVDV